jgi:hypothetical protein
MSMDLTFNTIRCLGCKNILTIKERTIDEINAQIIYIEPCEFCIDASFAQGYISAEEWTTNHKDD